MWPTKLPGRATTCIRILHVIMQLVVVVMMVLATLANGLKIPAASAVRASDATMLVPAAIGATPAQLDAEARAAPPCAFFGGGGGVPEGAKCIFRPGSPCNRKKCQVNKGPCKANHDSMK